MKKRFNCKNSAVDWFKVFSKLRFVKYYFVFALRIWRPNQDLTSNRKVCTLCLNLI